MAPSKILSPQVLAAFSRVGTTSATSFTSHALPCPVASKACAALRLSLFRASRALSILFGGLARRLDDQYHTVLEDFAILPIYALIKTPTLYQCYLARQSNTSVSAGRQCATKKGTISDPTAFADGTEDTYTNNELTDAPTHDSEHYDCFQSAVLIALDENDEQEADWEHAASNTEEGDWQDGASSGTGALEAFPAFIECLCLCCLGFIIPEVLGDQHNTECVCDSCNPVGYVTCQTKRVTTGLRCSIKDSPCHARTSSQVPQSIVTHSGSSSLLRYNREDPLLYNNPDISSSREDRDLTKSSMQDGGKKFDAHDGARRLSELCDTLAATKRYIEKQEAELLRPSNLRPNSQAFGDGAAMTQCHHDGDLLVFEGRSDTETISTNSRKTKRKETGAWWYQNRNDQEARMRRRPGKRSGAQPVFTIKFEPRSPTGESPVTPKKQTMDCAIAWMQRYWDAIDVVREVQNHKWLLDSDDEDHVGKPEDFSIADPFVAVSEFVSDSAERRSSQVAYNAWVPPEMDGLVDMWAKSRNNESGSPVPANRPRPPVRWRESHRARQRQLMQVGPNEANRAQVIAQHFLSSTISLGDADAHRTRSFLTPTVIVHLSRPATAVASVLSQPEVQATQYFFRGRKEL